MQAVVLVLLMSALVTLATLGILSLTDKGSADVELVYVSAQANYTGDLTDLYKALVPSVVSVISSYDGDRQYHQGSGFFIDGEYVITNQHVIDPSESVEVRLYDGTRLMAEVVGADVYTDLAVLRLERPVVVQPIAFANSSLIEPGTPVAAIGNPFGLHGSITSGIISARGRMLRSQDYLIPDILQMDAPVNPGNSGGPLVTLDGLLVGVTVAKEGDNVGFAIPSNTVARVTPYLIEEGGYTHPWMGVIVQPLTKRIAVRLNLSTSEGMQLVEVVNGSPAYEAGLRGGEDDGDIITEMGGARLRTFNEFMNQLDRHHPGDTVDVTYVRGGIEYEAVLTLGSRPQPE